MIKRSQFFLFIISCLFISSSYISMESYSSNHTSYSTPQLYSYSTTQSDGYAPQVLNPYGSHLYNSINPQSNGFHTSYNSSKKLPRVVTHWKKNPHLQDKENPLVYDHHFHLAQQMNYFQGEEEIIPTSPMENIEISSKNHLVDNLTVTPEWLEKNFVILTNSSFNKEKKNQIFSQIGCYLFNTHTYHHFNSQDFFPSQLLDTIMDKLYSSIPPYIKLEGFDKDAHRSLYINRMAFFKRLNLEIPYELFLLQDIKATHEIFNLRLQELEDIKKIKKIIIYANSFHKSLISPFFHEEKELLHNTSIEMEKINHSPTEYTIDYLKEAFQKVSVAFSSDLNLLFQQARNNPEISNLFMNLDYHLLRHIHSVLSNKTTDYSQLLIEGIIKNAVIFNELAEAVHIKKIADELNIHTQDITEATILEKQEENQKFPLFIIKEIEKYSFILREELIKDILEIADPLSMEDIANNQQTSSIENKFHKLIESLIKRSEEIAEKLINHYNHSISIAYLTKEALINRIKNSILQEIIISPSNNPIQQNFSSPQQKETSIGEYKFHNVAEKIQYLSKQLNYHNDNRLYLKTYDKNFNFSKESEQIKKQKISLTELSRHLWNHEYNLYLKLYSSNTNPHHGNYVEIDETLIDNLKEISDKYTQMVKIVHHLLERSSLLQEKLAIKSSDNDIKTLENFKGIMTAPLSNHESTFDDFEKKSKNLKEIIKILFHVEDTINTKFTKTSDISKDTNIADLEETKKTKDKFTQRLKKLKTDNENLEKSIKQAIKNKKKIIEENDKSHFSTHIKTKKIIKTKIQSLLGKKKDNDLKYLKEDIYNDEDKKDILILNSLRNIRINATNYSPLALYDQLKSAYQWIQVNHLPISNHEEIIHVFSTASKTKEVVIIHPILGELHGYYLFPKVFRLEANNSSLEEYEQEEKTKSKKDSTTPDLMNIVFSKGEKASESRVLIYEDKIKNNFTFHEPPKEIISKALSLQSSQKSSSHISHHKDSFLSFFSYFLMHENKLINYLQNNSSLDNLKILHSHNKQKDLYHIINIINTRKMLTGTFSYEVLKGINTNNWGVLLNQKDPFNFKEFNSYYLENINNFSNELKKINPYLWQKVEMLIQDFYIETHMINNKEEVLPHLSLKEIIKKDTLSTLLNIPLLDPLLDDEKNDRALLNKDFSVSLLKDLENKIILISSYYKNLLDHMKAHHVSREEKENTNNLFASLSIFLLGAKYYLHQCLIELLAKNWNQVSNHDHWEHLSNIIRDLNTTDPHGDSFHQDIINQLKIINPNTTDKFPTQINDVNIISSVRDIMLVHKIDHHNNLSLEEKAVMEENNEIKKGFSSKFSALGKKHPELANNDHLARSLRAISQAMKKIIYLGMSIYMSKADEKSIDNLSLSSHNKLLNFTYRIFLSIIFENGYSHHNQSILSTKAHHTDLLVPTDLTPFTNEYIINKKTYRISKGKDSSKAIRELAKKFILLTKENTQHLSHIV